MSDTPEKKPNWGQFDPLNPLDALERVPPSGKVEPASANMAKSEGILDAILKEIDTVPASATKAAEVIITSLEDIIMVCVKNGYDYFKIEPQESDVEITFVKEARDAEKKFIKFPLYTQLIVKIKTITSLDLSTIDKVQEGKWEIKLWVKNYILSSKIAPGKLGESLFVKVKVQEIKIKKKL